MKKTITFATALLLAGCAGVSEGRCIPWGEDACESTEEPRWAYIIEYEEGREPSEGSMREHRRASQVARSRCNIATTPWRPEKAVLVTVTDNRNGDQTEHNCEDYRH